MSTLSFSLFQPLDEVRAVISSRQISNHQLKGIIHHSLCALAENPDNRSLRMSEQDVQDHIEQ